MPASDDLLGAITFSGCAKVTWGSGKQWLASLCIWHTIHDIPWLGGEGLRLSLVSVGQAALVLSYVH